MATSSCFFKANSCNIEILGTSLMERRPFTLRGPSVLWASTLNYTTLHYTTLHYTKLNYTTLYYTTLHFTTLNMLSQYWPAVSHLGLWFIELHRIPNKSQRNFAKPLDAMLDRAIIVGSLEEKNKCILTTKNITI